MSPQGDVGKVSSDNRNSILGRIKARERNGPCLGAERTHVCRSRAWQSISVRSQILGALIFAGCAVALSVSATQLWLQGKSSSRQDGSTGVAVCQ